MELFQYASRMLGNSADAEDVVQTTFLKAHQNGAQPDNLRAWLYSITRNEVIDHLRRRRTQTTAFAALAVPVATEDASRPAERADTAERVAHAVAQLPEPYRDVIVLRFQQNLKFEEVARILSAPLGTVKVQAARGLKLLRERLKGVLEDLSHDL